MSTRVHNQVFECEWCAQQAQRDMRCAECGERLKLHYLDGKWVVLCMKSVWHKDLRAVAS